MATCFRAAGGYLLLGHILFENQLKIMAHHSILDLHLVIKSVDLIDEMSNYWENSRKNVPKNKDYNESSLLKLNCDKALKELNWQPTLSEETAKFTIDWYLNNATSKDIEVSHQAKLKSFKRYFPKE